MSLAVRFAIAIPKPTSKLRLALADALAEFCREHGFGLWLADSRSGYRAGNWFTICEHSTDTVRKLFDGALDPGNRSQAHACVPITLVGPARLDSLASLLDYLHSYHELGILACSMATIDDLAFIHLQLTINTEQVRLVQLNEAIDKLAAQSGSPPHVLPRLLARLVSRGVQDVGHEVKGRFAHRMGDYHLLTGPAIQVRPEVSPWRGALWVSWEVEGRDAELRYPFLALHDALARNPLWADSNVEYLICRKVRNSVLRGKGKLSFPADIATNNFGYEDIPSGLSAFSESIENAWRAELGERHRVRELTVSWREYWLGHWTSPLD